MNFDKETIYKIAFRVGVGIAFAVDGTWHYLSEKSAPDERAHTPIWTNIKEIKTQLYDVDGRTKVQDKELDDLRERVRYLERK